jgi:glycosyltransferase involved in cell wall biosynthesis
LHEPDASYDYPKEAAFVLLEKAFQSYLDAAAYINPRADACILQHEYNIFGGDDGVYLLSLLNALDVPLVTVLHTVLKKPSLPQKFIIEEICSLSEKVIVLSQIAKDITHSTYSMAPDKLTLIRHGVPVIQTPQAEAKEKLGLSGKRVILSFGLIDRNKGIETVLRALPEVVKAFPDVQYRVLGKTHPVIKRHFGEEYREFLLSLVEQLGLSEHVHFENRFIEQEELNLYLAATDVLITPYMNEEQVSSGPLSFAMGAGAALISTPFWHARELLAEDRGRLFDFRDSKALKEILMDLFEDPELFMQLRDNAAAFGRELRWPEMGKEFVKVVKNEIDRKKSGRLLSKAESFSYPELSFDHIETLTDPTGIISDAVYGLPSFENGYRLIDNARALYTVTMANRQLENEILTSLMTTYLSFIRLMQNEDGSFKQHLKYNRVPHENGESSECTGIVLWSLGYVIHQAPQYHFIELAKAIFTRAVPPVINCKNMVGKAYALMGLTHYLQAYRTDQINLERLHFIANSLKESYLEHKEPGWNWFDEKVDFDHAMIPLSLLTASVILKDEAIKSIGLKTMRFLTNLVIHENRLSLVGNKTWYLKGEEKSVFDQMPQDALGMVMLYKKAWEVTNNKRYLRLMRIAYDWFFGKNDLHFSIYNPQTKGCFDGLQENGVNRNQGAESSLALLLAGLTVRDAEAMEKQEKSQTAAGQSGEIKEISRDKKPS